ncbi:RNA-binding S4 domain-containing protein [Streptomyces aureus]|uniref:RNA-binding S4 domain-containing protein n=1 Tax=Streptomyces aureus TaxID=193461 RepID=UPI000AD898DC|nr:RNA-binding S4 domain-containing protein [Streptomyces aureus]
MASQGADGEMKGATAAGGRGADGARTAPAASGTTPENGAVPGSASASENASKASPAGTEASRTGTRSSGAASGTTSRHSPAASETAAVKAAVAAGPAGGESVRVDAWIWSVRLVKTRSIGATACKGGHVRVNGERVKPAYSVRAGDEVRVWHEGRERIVVVKRVIRKRVGAPVAAECYIDNSPPPPPREAVAPAGVRDRGAGRPTKRDRRDMERLRGMQTGSSGPVRTTGPTAGPTGTTGSARSPRH